MIIDVTMRYQPQGAEQGRLSVLVRAADPELADGAVSFVVNGDFDEVGGVVEDAGTRVTRRFDVCDDDDCVEDATITLTTTTPPVQVSVDIAGNIAGVRVPADAVPAVVTATVRADEAGDDGP